MKDLSCSVFDENTRTLLEGRELVHKVEEEQLAKRMSRHLSNGLNFCRKFFMGKYVLSIPLNSLEKVSR